MRKTVHEWLDANRLGQGLSKKKRRHTPPPQQRLAAATNATADPLAPKPRTTKRRKPK